MNTRHRTTRLAIVVALLLSTLAILAGPVAPPAEAATSGTYLHDIQIVEGKDTACPSGYSKDSTDFNSGAGGTALFGCWAFSDTRSGAVTRIVPRLNESCPSGTSQRGPNLNKGAGGDTIRLCVGFGENAGPPIGNVDVLVRDNNFLCHFEKGDGYYNAGRHTYGTADFGVDFNDGTGFGDGWIKLCIKPIYEDLSLTRLDEIGSTLIGRVDTWWRPSTTKSIKLRCPAGYGYNVDWRDRSPSDVVYITELANAETAERSLIVNNPSIDNRRVIIDIACSTYDFPTIPPGAGDRDSGCGAEGQRPCDAAVKLSGWRAPDWEFGAHQLFSCDRGLILDASNHTCKTETRHDNAGERDSWQTWALKQQMNILGADEPINWIPMIQTHNSYNNSADAYPIPNHFRSMSDQLDMGTRWLDLRPRWGKGGPIEEHMRLSHGNNECSVGCTSLDRPYFYGIREIAEWLDENPDEVLMISAQSTQHQIDDGGEAEVLAYLIDPLRKYIGESRILGPREWCDSLMGANSTTCAAVPHNSFTGTDYEPTRWPTRNEVKALGARVVVVTDAETDVTFAGDLANHHTFTDEFARNFKADECTMNGIASTPGSGRTDAEYLANFFKVYETRALGSATSEFEEAQGPIDGFDGMSQSWPGYLYAYTDEIPSDDGGDVDRPYAATAASVEQLVDCNLHVQLDMLGSDNHFNGTNASVNKSDGNSHADRRDAMIWSWRSGDYGQPNTCAVLDGDDGRFESRQCGEAHKIACATSHTNGYRLGDPAGLTEKYTTTWSVTANTYTWDRAFEGCGAEFPGTVPAVPTTKVQANALETAAAGQDVWLALTNRRADGQWSIQRTPPPVISYTLTSFAGGDYTAGTWTNKDVVVSFTCAAGSGRTLTENSANRTITIDSEGEDQTVTSTGVCADDAGNRSFDITVSNIDIDKTAPTLGDAAVGPAATNGWHKTDVTVTRPCLDSLSGVAAPEVSETLTAEGADQAVTLTCTDRAGNTVSAATTDIYIDKTAPTVRNVAVQTAKASTGWYRSDVVVQGECADALSGVGANTTASTTLDEDGANQTAEVVCTDVAGNAALGTLAGIDIDKTAPLMTPGVVSPAANENGWHKGTVTVTHTCSDATSGSTTPNPAKTLDGDGANQTVAVACSDRAGNVTTLDTRGINIDTAAPVAGLLTVSPRANSAGWHNSDITVERACSDPLSGIERATESTTLRTEGTGLVAPLKCTDKAGNTVDASQGGFKLDKTSPTMGDAVRNPLPNAFFWHRSDVTVTRACFDSLSGPVAPSASRTVRDEGADQSVSHTCTDVAGNALTQRTDDIDLDETKPVVTFTGQQRQYGLLETVAVDCTATDALSGIHVSDCTDTDRPAYSFDPGANTLHASAEDKAGNTNSALVTFSVDATYAELCTLTRRFVEPGTSTTPLCQQLTNAQRAESGGRAQAKQQAIEVYERLLDNAQSRREITAERGAILKKWSQSLLTGGCRRCTAS